MRQSSSVFLLTLSVTFFLGATGAFFVFFCAGAALALDMAGADFFTAFEIAAFFTTVFTFEAATFLVAADDVFAFGILDTLV